MKKYLIYFLFIFLLSSFMLGWYLGMDYSFDKCIETGFKLMDKAGIKINADIIKVKQIFYQYSHKILENGM